MELVMDHMQHRSLPVGGFHKDIIDAMLTCRIKFDIPSFTNSYFPKYGICSQNCKNSTPHNSNDWVSVQRRTFTAWIRNCLIDSGYQLNDLSTDFNDMIVIKLYEALSKKKITRYNKRSRMVNQKLDNISIALKHFNKDGVTFESIDSKALLEVDKKLVLGFIWKLILHYQIQQLEFDDVDDNIEKKKKSSEKMTSQQKLINWIGSVLNEKIPDISKGWEDGHRIAKMVNNTAPGLYLDYDKSKNTPLEITVTAMDLADKYLAVKKLMQPEDLVQPNVDKLSLMTYLVQFKFAVLADDAPIYKMINPENVTIYGAGVGIQKYANEDKIWMGMETTFYVKIAPQEKNYDDTLLNVSIKNMKNDIIVVTGAYDPEKKIHTLTYTPEQSGIIKIDINHGKVILTPTPYVVDVDASSSYFNPNLIKIFGRGILKDGLSINDTDCNIYVDSSKGGNVNLTCKVVNGNKETVYEAIKLRHSFNLIKHCLSYLGLKRSVLNDIFVIQPKYKETGEYTVTVLSGTTHIPKSPYTVNIGTEKVIEIDCFGGGLESSPARMPAKFEIKLKDNEKFESMSYKVIDPTGEKIEVTEKLIDDKTMQLEYVPNVLGEHKIHIMKDDEEVKNSPFLCTVVDINPEFDPTKIKMTKLPDRVTVNGVTEIEVDLRAADPYNECILNMYTINSDNTFIDCLLEEIEDGLYIYSLKPKMAGQATLYADVSGINIALLTTKKVLTEDKNTIEGQDVTVKDLLDFEAGLRFNIDEEFTICEVPIMETKAPECFSVSVDCPDGSTDSPVLVLDDKVLKLLYKPTQAGNHEVRIKDLDTNDEISESPFCLYIQPYEPNTVQLYGSGLLDGKTKEKKIIYAKLDKESENVGELKVQIKNSLHDSQCDINVCYNEDYQRFVADYYPVESGNHYIYVYYDETEVYGSPFFCNFAVDTDGGLVNINACEAYGKGILKNGMETGETVPVFIKNKNSKNSEISVKLINPDETIDEIIPIKVTEEFVELNLSFKDKIRCDYFFEYTPDKEGKYYLELKCGSLAFNGSPYEINVTHPKYTSITCYGPGIQRAIAGYTTCFRIDSNQNMTSKEFDITIDSDLPCKYTVKNILSDVIEINYTPPTSGIYTISIKIDGIHVAMSPYVLYAKPDNVKFHLDKITVESLPFENGFAKLNDENMVKVDLSKSKEAPLYLTVVDSLGLPCEVNMSVDPKCDSLKTFSFVPNKPGLHTAMLDIGGYPIGEPYITLNVLDNINIFGPGLKHCQLNVDTYFCVSCYNSADVKVNFENESIPVKVKLSPYKDICCVVYKIDKLGKYPFTVTVNNKIVKSATIEASHNPKLIDKMDNLLKSKVVGKCIDTCMSAVYIPNVFELHLTNYEAKDVVAQIYAFDGKLVACSTKKMIRKGENIETKFVYTFTFTPLMRNEKLSICILVDDIAIKEPYIVYTDDIIKTQTHKILLPYLEPIEETTICLLHISDNFESTCEPTHEDTQLSKETNIHPVTENVIEIKRNNRVVHEYNVSDLLDITKNVLTANEVVPIKITEVIMNYKYDAYMIEFLTKKSGIYQFVYHCGEKLMFPNKLTFMIPECDINDGCIIYGNELMCGIATKPTTFYIIINKEYATKKLQLKIFGPSQPSVDLIRINSTQLMCTFLPEKEGKYFISLWVDNQKIHKTPFETLILAPEAPISDWKNVQRRTFTAWIKNLLNKSNVKFDNMDDDFNDMTVIHLYEILSSKKITKYNKKSKMVNQKLDNISIALDNFQKDGVVFPSIDSQALMNKDKKLLLAFVWTLILNFQIKSLDYDDDSEDDLNKTKMTSEDKLIKWVKDMLPDDKIGNICAGWDDGHRLASIVDACAPGLYDDHIETDESPVERTTKAMDLADQYLNVSKLMTPEDMMQPNVDKLSLLTYLVQFPSAKVSDDAPISKIIDPKYVQFEGAGIGESEKPVTVDQPTNFLIKIDSELKDYDPRHLNVILKNDEGKKLKVLNDYNPEKMEHNIEYTPEKVGKLNACVKHGRTKLKKKEIEVIEKSAFDPAKVKVFGRGIFNEGLNTNDDDKAIYVNVTDSGDADLVCKVKRPNSDNIEHAEIEKIKDKPNLIEKVMKKLGIDKKDATNYYKIEPCYEEPGDYEVSILYDNKDVASSPYIVKVDDIAPENATCVGNGVTLCLKNFPAKIDVTAKSKSVLDDLTFDIRDPKGNLVQVEEKFIDENKLSLDYTPNMEGLYQINVLEDGKNIKDSPFLCPVINLLDSFDPSKIIVSNVPDSINTNNAETIEIDTRKADPEKKTVLDIYAVDEDGKLLEAKLENDDGEYKFKIKPGKPGEVKVYANINGLNLAILMNNAVKTDVDDVKKAVKGDVTLKDFKECTEPLVIEVVDKFEVFEIPINATKSADNYSVCIDLPDGRQDKDQLLIEDNGFLKLLYKPTKPGYHLVHIDDKDTDIPIAESPFLLCAAPSSPDTVRIYGPGLINARVGEPSILYAKIEGEKKELQINVKKSGSNDVIENTMKYDSESQKFTIEFVPKLAGNYYIYIYYNDNEVYGSPFFTVVSLKSKENVINIAACEAFGKGVLNEGLNTKEEAQVFVKSKNAGKGKMTANLIKPDKSFVKIDPIIVDSEYIANNPEFVDKIRCDHYFTYSSEQPGKHYLEIKYEDVNITSSPFEIIVDEEKYSDVKCYGPGIKRAIAGYPTCFQIDTNKNKEDVEIKIVSDITCEHKLVSILDDVQQVTYTPSVSGIYIIYVTIKDENISSSPYVVYAKPDDIKFDANKVIVKSPVLENHIAKLNDYNTLCVDTSKSGEAPLYLNVTDSEGVECESKVEKIVKDGKKLTALSFKPVKADNYTLCLDIGGVPIGKAFEKILVTDIAAYGPGVAFSEANVENYFIVACKDSDSLDFKFNGPKDVKYKIKEVEGGEFAEVWYTTPEIGKYDVTITDLILKKEIMKLNIVSEVHDTEKAMQVVETVKNSAIIGQIIDTKFAAVCEPNNFEIELKNYNKGTVKAIFYDIKGTEIECVCVKQDEPQEISEKRLDTVIYKCTFSPESKYHSLVLCASIDNMPIGNPIYNIKTVDVVNAKKIKVLLPYCEDIQNTDIKVFHYADKKSKDKSSSSSSSSSSFSSDSCSKKSKKSKKAKSKSDKKSKPKSDKKSKPKSDKKSKHKSKKTFKEEIPSNIKVVQVNEDEAVNDAYQLEFIPTEIGNYEIQYVAKNKTVFEDPITFVVDEHDADECTLIGPGVICGLKNQPVVFDLYLNEKYSGIEFEIKIDGPDKTTIQYDKVTEEHLICTFIPKEEGKYQIMVEINNEVINKTLYEATILSNDMNKLIIDGKVIKYSVADLDKINYYITTPSEKQVYCELGKNQFGNLTTSFETTEKGIHLLHLLENEKPLKNTPIEINVFSDPSIVTIEGDGIYESVVNVENEFIVNSSNAGLGNLKIEFTGPSEIKLNNYEHSPCRNYIRYLPDTLGTYEVDVLFADQHIPGSPFTMKVVEDGKVQKSTFYDQSHIPEIKVNTPVNLSLWVSEPIDVNNLNGHLYDPDNELVPLNFEYVDDTKFDIQFTPKKSGEYTISILNEYIPVSGSPFSVNIGSEKEPELGELESFDEVKVKLIIDPLQSLIAGQKVLFSLHAVEAGQGNIVMTLTGKHPSYVKMNNRYDQDDSEGKVQKMEISNGDIMIPCEFMAKRAGTYTIKVLFNDREISESPYTFEVADNDDYLKEIQVTASRNSISNVNNEMEYTISHYRKNDVIKAKVVTPENKELFVELKRKMTDGKENIDAKFTPTVQGIHFMNVYVNGCLIPKSPFTFNVGFIVDASLIKYYGDGLTKATVGKEATFMVDISRIYVNGIMVVRAVGPSEINFLCQQTDDVFQFKYTPEKSGYYWLNVFYNSNIVNSVPILLVVLDKPDICQLKEVSNELYETSFNITANKQNSDKLFSYDSDSSKINVYGNGIMNACIDKINSFIIESKDAGHNTLLIGICGRKLPCKDLHVTYDTEKQHYVINYRVPEPGQYKIAVIWGDDHIVGSPFYIHAV
ncbi:hypothetical protein A3Q56_01266 [Intoshia linei]|uniref:Calponin-homology (CH) domain-containing protein n=1 Tax=Intoshia linei TaxID=1819745 RepID=A0A177BBH7_9BILA|nr:hypothetical protein A3Q56_01266 [Intoshia linei]